MASKQSIISQVHAKWVEAYQGSIPYRPDAWRGEDYSYSYMDVEAPMQAEWAYQDAVDKALDAGTADVVSFQHPRRVSKKIEEGEDSPYDPDPVREYKHGWVPVNGPNGEEGAEATLPDASASREEQVRAFQRAMDDLPAEDKQAGSVHSITRDKKGKQKLAKKALAVAVALPGIFNYMHGVDVGDIFDIPNPPGATSKPGVRFKRGDIDRPDLEDEAPDFGGPGGGAELSVEGSPLFGNQGQHVIIPMTAEMFA